MSQLVQLLGQFIEPECLSGVQTVDRERAVFTIRQHGLGAFVGREQFPAVRRIEDVHQRVGLVCEVFYLVIIDVLFQNIGKNHCLACCHTIGQFSCFHLPGQAVPDQIAVRWRLMGSVVL